MSLTVYTQVFAPTSLGYKPNTTCASGHHNRAITAGRLLSCRPFIPGCAEAHRGSPLSFSPGLMNSILVFSPLLFDDNGNARPQYKTDMCQKRVRKKEKGKERKGKEKESLPDLDSGEIIRVHLEGNLNSLTDFKRKAEVKGLLHCPGNALEVAAMTLHLFALIIHLRKLVPHLEHRPTSP